MVAIPLRVHIPFVLVTMSIFWCGAVAGMLILHSTYATEPASGSARPAPDPPKAIRVVAVHSALPVETTSSAASTTFDDRWSARELQPAMPTTIKDARAQVAATEPKPPAPELKRELQDPVCGARGRRYYYIARHKYWRCVR